MSLEFRKRRFRKPDKNGQLAIALGAVALGLCIAIAWIAISFRPQPNTDSSSSDGNQSDAASYDNAAPTNLLVMLTDEGYERFTLVQISPADQQVRVATVPALLADDDGNTLVSTMRKTGLVDAVTLTTNVLQLPIHHYIALNADKAESWFNYLENGIEVTLTQTVDFTDEAGAVIRLDEGEHNLTATQTVALLRYDGWQDVAVTRRFPAEIMAAMINQHATAQRRYASDFSTLSNLCRTSLRIGDFNDFLPALKHTASTEDTLCVIEELKGSYQTDRFVFDYKATAKESSIYSK